MPDAKLHVMDHPLILHKISMLRDKETNTKSFRQLICEIALLGDAGDRLFGTL